MKKPNLHSRKGAKDAKKSKDLCRFSRGYFIDNPLVFLPGLLQFVVLLGIEPEIGAHSKAKKKSVFPLLNDSEVDELEEIVRNSC